MGYYGDLALVAWRETHRVGDWIHMRRGTGEAGWWHDHHDGEDGWHPADERDDGSRVCRDCGAVMDVKEAAKEANRAD